ncbi:MAG TPA: hypothetical protein VLV56_12285 [Burkholderiales bacterium]|nr:hypothetical protein [Burkholderiales bacterium]
MRSTIEFRRWRVVGQSLAFFALVSCGGGSSAPPTPGSKVFIVDAGNHSIASAVNPILSPSTTSLRDRVVAGSNTGLGVPSGIPSVSSIPSIALDGEKDRLFVATQNGGALVFDNSGFIDGNAPYSRRITASATLGGSGTRVVNFLYIALDTAHDVLYSMDPLGDLHVFSNASTQNGATTPDRTITPDLGTNTFLASVGVAIDVPRDMLYVALVHDAGSSIIVFNNASTTSATTPIAPNRTLNFPAGVGSFFLDDAHDRLYVAPFGGKVLVFDNASTLSGPPVPDRTIDLNFVVGDIQLYIFVDASRDKLYAVGSILGTCDVGVTSVIDNASTVDGVNIMGIVFSECVNDVRLSAVAVKP